jgi:PhnB protein
MVNSEEEDGMTTQAAPSTVGTTVSAYLCVKGAGEAIDFYTRTFGAVEQYRMDNGDGRIGHAEIKIGATTIMLSDEWPEMNVLSPLSFDGHSVSFVLTVPNADDVFERAVGAGAKVERPLTDEAYGRAGWLTDPFGHRWCITTPNPNFSDEGK